MSNFKNETAILKKFQNRPRVFEASFFKNNEDDKKKF